MYCISWHLAFDTSTCVGSIIGMDPEMHTFLHPHASRSVRSSESSIATVQDVIISVAPEESILASVQWRQKCHIDSLTGTPQDLHRPSSDRFGPAQ